jgi:diacylglycerol O-acyltransferase / wax synthase
MQQLTGLDAAFLYIETPSTFGHVSSLTMYDPETATGRLTFRDMRDLLEERLHLLPPFRRRLVDVPFGLDHPYWIEDPDFDLDFHVRHTGVPPPGDDRQLADVVARLVARPLDRTRPLWELYFIEGLEDGHVAVLTKMHHSAIDGVSGAEVLATLLDLEPEPRKVDPPARPWKPERAPGQLEMLGRGALTILGRPGKALSLQRRALQMVGNQPRLREIPVIALLPVLANLGAIAIPALTNLLGRAQRRVADGEILDAPRYAAPRTSLNRTITPHRRYAFGSLSLDDVKAVKNAFGCTVNDVVMAICAGGLRRWLVAHRELPREPLLAMVPVSIRTDEEQGSFGNKVSAMVAPIFTNVEDPAERLELIHDAMLVAKEQHKATPAELLTDFAQFSMPALTARVNRVIARTKLADRVAVPFNVVISNVPGPNFPLYSAGARLVGSYPVSALTDGIGLNLTVMSYMGNLDFGLLACREIVPDIWRLLGYLGDSLEELKKAAKLDRTDASSP